MLLELVERLANVINNSSNAFAFAKTNISFNFARIAFTVCNHLRKETILQIVV